MDPPYFLAQLNRRSTCPGLSSVYAFPIFLGKPIFPDFLDRWFPRKASVIAARCGAYGAHPAADGGDQQMFGAK
jgi:hypothetical protein